VGNYDEILTQQITALVECRKQFRQGNAAAGMDRVKGKKKKVSPKIISDIQIVPPGRTTRSEILTCEEEGPQIRNTADDGWQAVVNKSVKKKKNNISTNPTEEAREKQATKGGNPGTRGNKPKEGNKSTPKRRAPRTAAVAIKGVTEGFSYVTALKSLREKIALSELEIKESHIRKAANGGVIIKIPGVDRVNKAEKLKAKVAEVLGASAQVSRPSVKGELRIISFDDSVVVDEIADVVAAVGVEWTRSRLARYVP